MRKSIGQHLTEFTVVGTVILSVCLLSVFFFGDSIASVFNDNPMLSIFKGRAGKNIDPHSLLSGISVSVNGQNYSSPVEDVIRRNLQNGQQAMTSGAMQTSGSSGQITRETVEVTLQYIAQLNEMIKTLEANGASPESVAAVKNTAMELGKATIEYALADGLDANTPTAEYIKNLVNDNSSLKQELSLKYPDINWDNPSSTGNADTLAKLVNNLDIAVDLSKNGLVATNFKKAIDDLLNNNSLNASYETLMSKYADSILNLGQSIDYKIDSRIVNEFNAEAAVYNNAFNNAKSVITEYLNEITDANLKAELLNNLSILGAKNLSELNNFDLTKIYDYIDNSMLTLPAPGSEAIYSTSSSTRNCGIFATCNVNNSNVKFTSSDITLNVDYITRDGLIIDTDWVDKSIIVGGTIISQNNDVKTYLEQVPNLGINLNEYTVFKNADSNNDKTFYLVKNSSFTSTGINENDVKLIQLNLTVPTPRNVSFLESLLNPNSRENAVKEAYSNATINSANNYEKNNSVNMTNEYLTNIKEQIEKMAESYIDSQRSIINKLSSGQLTAEQKSNYEKQINVYRNGNYTDILPDTYNGKQLCKSLGFTDEQITNNKCDITF